MKYDIDPFEEEDWEEEDDIQLEDIYDVVYGSLMGYYKDYYMKCHLIKTDNDVALFEKSDIDDDNKLICSFSIDNNKISSLYELKSDTASIKRSYTTFKLTKNLDDDKYNFFKNFRFIFNEYIKTSKK